MELETLIFIMSLLLAVSVFGLVVSIRQAINEREN